jgi:hypothetical protein
MRRVLRCLGLALALALLPAVIADDKEKKADDDKAAHKDKKEASEKFVAGPTGKLVHWEGPQKHFTVQIDVTVPDPNGVKRMAELQLQLARAKNAQEILNARNAMAGVKTVMVKQEKVEFQPAADFKIRVANPIVFDDKGKPKKLSQLTRKERDELKGPDKHLPGYGGTEGDVHQDSSIVTVYVLKATKPAKPAGGKDDKGLTDTRPEAVLILVQGEAPPPK